MLQVVIHPQLQAAGMVTVPTAVECRAGLLRGSGAMLLLPDPAF